MPQFIRDNYKAWTASISGAVGVAIFSVIQLHFPTIATPELQQWIAGGVALIVAGGFTWLITWLSPPNAPNAATMIAQGQADPLAKSEIKAAAATLNAKPVAEPVAAKKGR